MDERDYLVTKVFPSLRRYCEERDVTLFELDLRWGISEEESKQGKVVDICLKEIQNTRPFFIGLLGERYGWVPSEDEQKTISQNTNVLEDYPWVRAELEIGTSITEIEIQEGVLKSEKKVNAYFYLRSPEMEVPAEFRENAGSPAARKLQNLKNRIRGQKEYSVKDYNSIEELGQFVEKDFKELVDSLFPEGALSELEKERLEQQNFLKSKTSVYIPIPGYENKLDDFIRGKERTLVITAPSGIGKSAFLADWIAKRQKNPMEGVTIIFHFIGTSQSEGDRHKIIQRLINEVRDIYGIKNEADEADIPSATNSGENKVEDTQKKILRNLLFAIPPEQKLVVILDGADKLDGDNGLLKNNINLLSCFDTYPENVKLIFSALETGSVMTFSKRREYPLIAITSLDIECRRRLIADYLLSFGKKLSSVQVERIAQDNESGNPLVLRALLDEIRLFGVFEKLDAEIDRYLAAPDIPAFFTLILGRMENAFKSKKNIAKEILSLICVSRNGLSEQEILDLSGAAPLYWSQMYNALSGHVSVQNGLVTLTHPFMQDAIKREWLKTKEAEESYRKKIAAYMKMEEVPPDRRNREYPFQLYELKDWDNLYAFLLNLEVFQYRYEMDRHELEKYWQSLRGADGNKYAFEKYLDIDTADKDKETLCIVYNKLGIFSRDILSDLKLSLKFYQKALNIREKVLGKNNPNTITNYNDLGDIYSKMSDYPKALEFFQKALAIREEVLVKNHPDTAFWYNRIGSVYINMGNYLKALEFFQKALAICEEALVKNDHLTSIICDNIGWVYDKTGDYPKALEFYQKALAIEGEVVGKNNFSTAHIYNNIGSCYNNMGNYPKALEFHQKALAIQEKILLKYHPDTADSYFMIGDIYNNMHDYPKALKFHQKALAIREEGLVNNHPSTANSYDKIGWVYDKMSDYPKALEFYQKALAVSEKVLGKNHSSTAITYENIGWVYDKMGDYPKVLEFYQKALIIREVLGKSHPDTAFSYNNIGLVYNNLCDYPKALEFYQKALAICKEILEKNDNRTAACCNNIGNAYHDMSDYPKALEFHQEALAIREEVLGKNSPDTAFSYNKISDDYTKLGNKEKADEFRLKALHIDGLLIKNIPPEEQIGELAETAVKQNGLALEFVADKTLPICTEAVKQNSGALKFAPEAFRALLEAGI
ncbi:tetratricopeptide repeat domain protein [Leadbettera azotonutricia ZAS-9]|uniref:Nephrocystin-3 n=2 Tax=Leadbettera azotonutricia TaxID=150829 RepID=F5Y6W0_LEAAZ|nr:tetratricopeptide repeat domain protein [Leadbettera azotonutricia ZAS-9]